MTQVPLIAQNRKEKPSELSGRVKQGASVALVQICLTEVRVGLCDGVLLLLAQRPQQDGGWQDGLSKKRYGKEFDGPITAKVKHSSAWEENADRIILRL